MAQLFKVPGQSEHDQQRLLFTWARQMAPMYPELELMFAVPNAAKRSVQLASYMKAEGVKSGVPDVWLPVPRGKFHGLVIEMKIKDNPPTANQAWWLTRLAQQGYCTRVAHRFEEARDLVYRYLKGEL